MNSRTYSTHNRDYVLEGDKRIIIWLWIFLERETGSIIWFLLNAFPWLTHWNVVPRNTYILGFDQIYFRLVLRDVKIPCICYSCLVAFIRGTYIHDSMIPRFGVRPALLSTGPIGAARNCVLGEQKTLATDKYFSVFRGCLDTDNWYRRLLVGFSRSL